MIIVAIKYFSKRNDVNALTSATYFQVIKLLRINIYFSYILFRILISGNKPTFCVEKLIICRPIHVSLSSIDQRPSLTRQQKTYTNQRNIHKRKLGRRTTQHPIGTANMPKEKHHSVLYTGRKRLSPHIEPNNSSNQQSLWNQEYIQTQQTKILGHRKRHKDA